MDEVNPFDIPKREVWEAFKKVKANQGAAGVDGQTIAGFEADLSNNLYELWNRLSSGRETGFVEGESIAIEYRWARGRYQQLPAMATELVRPPDSRTRGDRGRPFGGRSEAGDFNDPDRIRDGRRPNPAGLVRAQPARRERDGLDC